jgi:nicotinate-nucleotide pyrophosphorylase (carboxylating)
MKNYEIQASDIAQWWRSEAELDRSAEDRTTRSILEIAPGVSPQPAHFYLLAKQNLVFSGAKILKWVSENKSGWSFRSLPEDGAALEKGTAVAHGKAPLESLLGHERILLNLLQHLSGIALQTRTTVESVRAAWKFPDPPPAVFHTRKFQPSLRKFQAEAVLHGGGQIHRMDLADRILFKDNHKKVLRTLGISLVDYYHHLKVRGEIESALIEVENVEEGLQALECGVTHLMLDNFGAEETRAFFSRAPARRFEIELSGNLTPERLPALLMDPRIRRLSFGSLTHSVRAADISLEIEP